MYIFTIALVLSSTLIFSHNVSGQQTDLYSAVKLGNQTAVESFLKDGGDVNHVIESQGTLLQVAFVAKQAELARYLIDSGADVNLVSDQNDQPPITLAIRLDDLDFLDFLINNGANLNSEDGVGRTPLFKTLTPDRPAARSLLLERGAEVNKPLDNGVTVIIEAISKLNGDAIKQLLASDAVIDGELVEKTTCASCHSEQSPGVTKYSGVPHMAGQHAEYTSKILKDYHTGRISNTKMERFVGVFLDEVNEAVANYYENLPRYKNKQTGSAEIREQGKTMYETNCSTCHGSDGITTKNQLTPTVAGQNSAYVSNQLRAYKSGERANDKDSEMRDISAGLTRDDIFAVSEYIQSMHW